MKPCLECQTLLACPDYITKMVENQLVTNTQGTDEWLEARKQMITASDVPSILGENFPQTASKVVYQKVVSIVNRQDGMKPQERNEAMNWGIAYEKEAAERFIKETGHKLVFVGLLRHPSIPTLGASPDGITWCGKILEIKCPYNKIGDSLRAIPKRYVGQVETQLAVTGFNNAYFVQYRPPGFGDKGVLEPNNPGKFHLLEYVHDPCWTKKAMPLIERATNDMHRLIQSFQQPFV